MKTFTREDGVRICFVEEGPRDGMAVCLIHGSAGDHTTYDWQIPALTEAGYRVIAIDRFGRGESDTGTTRFHCTIEAEDYWKLLDSIGARRAALAGRSSGAGVIRKMYFQQPDRVIGLISVDSVSFAKLCDPNRDPDIEGSVDRGPDPRFDPEIAAAYERNKAFLQKFDRLWDHPSDMNVGIMLARKTMSAGSRRRKAAWAALPDDTSRPDVSVPLPEGKWCKVPLLAYTAGRGRIGPDDPEAKALAEEMPAEDGTLVVIKNSSHAVNWENVGLFNRELLKFLDRLKRAEG